MSGFVQDVRYAFRELRKSPSFTVVAVITLALGIGANTALCGMVYGGLLRSLPLKGPGRLYTLSERNLKMEYEQNPPAEAVMELLRNLHSEGATICMVTHDPRFAKHAQREVHLFDGKVVAEEELKKLMTDVHA